MAALRVGAELLYLCTAEEATGAENLRCVWYGEMPMVAGGLDVQTTNRLRLQDVLYTFI